MKEEIIKTIKSLELINDNGNIIKIINSMYNRPIDHIIYSLKKELGKILSEELLNK